MATRPVERRKDYQELLEIKVQLAVVVNELRNVIDALHSHQARDDSVENRVKTLEEKEARLTGRILGLGAFCTFAGLILSKIPKWF